MSGFSVQLDTLGSAAAHLRGTLTIVGDWDRRKADLAAAAPSAGHEIMTSAVTGFCDEWSYGFGHLAEDIETLASALEQAHAAYTQTECALTDAMGGS